MHLLGDALGSVGALLAGGLVWAFGWNWTDPAASVLIAVLVLYSGWRLLREAIAVLMGTAPANVDINELHRAITALLNILAVHDLHVWSITSGMPALTAHVVAAKKDYRQEILALTPRCGSCCTRSSASATPPYNLKRLRCWNARHQSEEPGFHEVNSQSGVIR